MKNKKWSVIIGMILFLNTGCEKGWENEEVPEEVYNEVGLGEEIAFISSRELWKDVIWAKNFKQYVTAITISTIGNYQVPGSYTNGSAGVVNLGDTVLQPGETMVIKNKIVPLPDRTAPEDTLYLVYAYADAWAIHWTPQVGYQFDAEKIEADAVYAGRHVTLAGDVLDGHLSEALIIDVDPRQIVVGMSLKEDMACRVEPVGGAPELGKPGDFSVPRRYWVINENERPGGLGQRKRLYEIRVIFLP